VNTLKTIIAALKRGGDQAFRDAAEAFKQRTFGSYPAEKGGHLSVDANEFLELLRGQREAVRRNKFDDAPLVALEVAILQGDTEPSAAIRAADIRINDVLDMLDQRARAAAKVGKNGRIGRRPYTSTHVAKYALKLLASKSRPKLQKVFNNCREKYKDDFAASDLGEHTVPRDFGAFKAWLNRIGKKLGKRNE
jgi:hypothetical protein